MNPLIRKPFFISSFLSFVISASGRAELAVTMASPARGELVAGPVTVVAQVTGNEPVKSVRFVLNGITQFTDTVAPYEWVWDASTAPGIRNALEIKAVRLSDGLVGADSGIVPVYRRVEESEAQQRLLNLVAYLAGLYNDSGDIRLVPALPTGFTYDGTPRFDLQKTFWVQNNALYLYRGIMPWRPDIASGLGASYLDWHARYLAPLAMPRDGMNLYPVGSLPPYDDGLADDKYRKAITTTVPANTPTREFTLGMDTSGLLEASITPDSPRNLLKYGVLRQVLRGNRALAETYFRQSLATWDGIGFVEPKTQEVHGYYYGRTLAFTLLSEKALGLSIDEASEGLVTHDDVVARLWSLQDASGGMWVTFDGERGIAIGSNKMTPETASLTLLAYGPNLWDQEQARLTEAPRAPALVQGEPTRLTLIWAPPSHVTSHVSYRVDLALEPGFSSIVNGYGDHSAGTSTNIVFEGLSPNTLYHARVHALDNVSLTRYTSVVVAGQTIESAPDPVVVPHAEPNPWNGQGTVRFVGFAPYDTLNIYNSKGGRVQTVRTDGSGGTDWDGLNKKGKRAPSGTYSVKSGSGVTIKLVIQR